VTAAARVFARAMTSSSFVDHCSEANGVPFNAARDEPIPARRVRQGLSPSLRHCSNKRRPNEAPKMLSGKDRSSRSPRRPPVAPVIAGSIPDGVYSGNY
jgi:hypothetical protein